MKLLLVVSVIVIICIGVIVSFRCGHKIALRNHGDVSIAEVCTFSESIKEIKNPNRGFYFIYGFIIGDDKEEDYYKILSERFVNSHAHSLVMMQINLQEYSDGPISQEGLDDIHELFEAMSQFDKQYLVRFLYDWDGENVNVEPQNIDIILGHMDQLNDIFYEYNDIIFVHQGLFIGNWGEMNGSGHLESMKELAEKLLEVTAGEIFLSVRMPAQWRNITQIADSNILNYDTKHIARRIGLFNDGMMGNYSDCGTYGDLSRRQVGDFSFWNRTEELIFQEELCKYVPNGGEVIIDNEYNDYLNAINNLKQMHITYLNSDYDRAVLKKWKDYIINDDSIYNGMDGLSYIDRHLGYRLLIKEVDMRYDVKEDVLSIKINMQNVGFAPIYKPVEVYIQFVNTETNNSFSYLVEADISKLTGGNDNNSVLPIIYEQNLEGFSEGTYEIFFRIIDVDSRLPIYLANEQEYEAYGYKLGEIYIEQLRNSIEKHLKK